MKILKYYFYSHNLSEILYWLDISLYINWDFTRMNYVLMSWRLTCLTPYLKHLIMWIDRSLAGHHLAFSKAWKYFQKSGWLRFEWLRLLMGQQQFLGKCDITPQPENFWVNSNRRDIVSIRIQIESPLTFQTFFNTIDKKKQFGGGDPKSGHHLKIVYLVLKKLGLGLIWYM